MDKSCMGNEPAGAAADLLELMVARRTTLPKRLVAPGPTEAQLRQCLAAAATAPDHNQLLPWRFVRIPLSQRAALGDALARALIERDPAATEAQQAQAREKAARAPELLLLVVDGERGDPEVDVLERTLSAGCAVQNLLLMATAMGYGSALTSGKGLKAKAVRDLFGLGPGEHAVCFVSLGTPTRAPLERARPAEHALIRVLGDDPGASVP
jgi:nitroreductase